MYIKIQIKHWVAKVGLTLNRLALLGAVSIILNVQADRHGPNSRDQGQDRHNSTDVWLLTLAKHPQWLALLHMRPHLPFNHIISEVDDKAFFLSSEGKYNALQELTATLKAFAQPPNQEALDKSPQCRFPARFHWLKKVIPHQVAASFIETECPTFERVFERIHGNQLTLVFPASQLNSPSSMYGHTLFRLDRNDRHNLLNFSITFAAYADPNDNELVYSFKGLFGGYPGYFSVVPYHQKVKEYSRMESRDVWEYPLNITQEDIDQLIRHAWELNEIQFDYYFFNENCSYRLLTLIDAANIQYNLTEAFRFKAIPLDTVKAFADRHLLKDAEYRASHTTQIKHMLAHSNSEQIQSAKTWAAATTPLSKSAMGFLTQSDQPESENSLTQAQRINQAQTLDLAIAYNRELARHNAAPEPILRARAIDLLSQRSQLNSGNSFPPIVPPSISDDQGHPSNQLYLALGQQAKTTATREPQQYIDTELRLAYHHFLDPLDGYQPGSTLEMGRFRFRFSDQQGIQLQNASILNIESFSPRNPMMNPWSWRVQTGFDRFLAPRSAMFATVNGGGGITYPVGRTGLLYALAALDLRASPLFKQQHGLSLGPEIGLLFSQSGYRLQLEYGYLAGVTDKEADRQFGEIQFTNTITASSQIGIQWRYEASGLYQHGYHEANLGYHWYF
jgi:hypothetical protein